MELARKTMEGGGRAEDIFEMPLCRFVVLFDLNPGGQTRKINSREEMIEFRNEMRAKKGLPPLTIK